MPSKGEAGRSALAQPKFACQLLRSTSLKSLNPNDTAEDKTNLRKKSRKISAQQAKTFQPTWRISMLPLTYYIFTIRKKKKRVSNTRLVCLGKLIKSLK
jgi:hypothetical protein